VVVDKLIDIRASVDNSNFLFALSFTRALITARDEGIINTTDIPVAFINLYNATIPARGQIASSTVQMKLSATGFTPTTTLESWGTLNKTLVDKTLTSFDSVADLIGKKKLFYDGYPSAANSGGMLHIGQILEFAWEEFV
jgi:hypothetical protein